VTDDLTALYRQSVFIRTFEEAIALEAEKGKTPGLVHLCNGSEVVEVSICSVLTGPKDQVTGSHRSHGLALAMGADPIQVAAEILGKPGGLSSGRGGTQHLFASDAGFLCSNGIVGAQVPLAAGAALSAKTMKTGGVAACFFGDGAANQGAVFETMNLAVALKLPLLFILENNGVGQTTTSEYASGGASFTERASAFGLKTATMDGFDAENCLSVATEMVSYVRENCLPAFIEASVPRLSGHYHGAAPEVVVNSRDPLDSLVSRFSSEESESIRKDSVKKIKLIMRKAFSNSSVASNIEVTQ